LISKCWQNKDATSDSDKQMLTTKMPLLTLISKC
jgi:hypothetical protein